jgi:hypothetical protein
MDCGRLECSRKLSFFVDSLTFFPLTFYCAQDKPPFGLKPTILSHKIYLIVSVFFEIFLKQVFKNYDKSMEIIMQC